MTISDAQDVIAEDHLNVFHSNGNTLIGKNGTHYIPVYVNNVVGDRTIKLALWGRAAGASATAMVHGTSRHYHGNLLLNQGSTFAIDAGYGAAASYLAQNIQISGGDQSGSTKIGDDSYSTSIPYTAVPQAVQIWIDGSEYTATIDDPNGKGATMYDSANDDWGIDGTTAWDTGWLNLSALISWTAGWHYIEIKETGGTGGVLVYVLRTNTGGDQA